MCLMFDAVRERREREHNERAWLAWHIAALQRQKKLKPLKDLLIKPRSRKRQTPAEQKAILRAIAATFGGLKRNG